MSIVLVKTISTDNGEERFYRRSTNHTKSYELSAEQFSGYLKDCESYKSHIEQGELYTVISHLLKF